MSSKMQSTSLDDSKGMTPVLKLADAEREKMHRLVMSAKIAVGRVVCSHRAT